jgi:hypothetical protein
LGLFIDSESFKEPNKSILYGSFVVGAAMAISTVSFSGSVEKNHVENLPEKNQSIYADYRPF